MEDEPPADTENLYRRVSPAVPWSWYTLGDAQLVSQAAPPPVCLSHAVLNRELPISPTDPITNCFLTGREPPCSAEEAGASLLLWCDQPVRYTPTDRTVNMCTVCVWPFGLIESDIHIQASSAHPAFSLLTYWM